LQRAKPLINHKKDKEKKGGREDGRERETERERERERDCNCASEFGIVGF
jgi:hypothetical protein